MSFLPDEQGEDFKVNLYDHGAGVVVGDYDGDGRDDVLFLNQLGPNGLYRNLGDGQFEDVSHNHPELALADRICVGGTFADYDNDGDQDLYITSTRGGNVLFQNVGGGRFEDVTQKAGVVCVAHSQTAAFFDYDSDGYLDLFVTNTARWTRDEYSQETRHYLGPATLGAYSGKPDDVESNRLFRNNRDGTFVDVTDEASAGGEGWSGDVAIFDFDDDGDQDLFITNMFGLSRLLKNDGEGHFTNVVRDTLKRTSFGAIGCKAFDYDNDGRLDLFVTDMHSDMWMNTDEFDLIEDPRRKYRYLSGRKYEWNSRGPQIEAELAERFQLDYEALVFGNTLFRNRGNGVFEELSDDANVETLWPWGIAVGDFDNNGYQDLYLPSGMGYPYIYSPSSLLMNGGGGRFREEASIRGIEPPKGGQFLKERIGGRAAARSSRCAAVADFDRDGRLDVVVNNFNDWAYLYWNRFPKHNYIEIRLTGTKSNRDAIGAVVTLTVGRQVMVQQVNCAGGYLSQSSKTLHFGLGDSRHIDHAQIRWPSGIRQTIQSPKINEQTEIREPASSPDDHRE